MKLTFENTKQFEKLELVSRLKNKSVEEYITDIVIDHINNINVNDIIDDVKRIFREDDTGYTPKEGEYVIPPSSRKLFVGKIVMKRDKLYTPKNGKRLVFDVYDMLLIRESISHLTKEEHKQLQKTLNTSPQQLNHSIWNIMNNSQLNELLDSFVEKTHKCTFDFIDGKLHINGEETIFLRTDLQDITHRVTNCSFKEQCIHNIQKMYPKKLHTRIVCENYDNPQLLKFLKEVKPTKVINNREKRANMLLNGGI